jgi:nicotinamidase/pyrazinamidase
MYKLAVIIDAQVDFMREDGALYVPGAEAVIPTINQYLDSLRLEYGYLGAVFTVDTHDEETYGDSEEAKQFPPHCLMGTDGFEFAVDTRLVLSEKEGGVSRKMMNKGVFDMWAEHDVVVRPMVEEGEPIPNGGEKPRDQFFKDLKDMGVDDIEIVGVASDFCVKDAIMGFLARDFRVTVYDNLVAGIQRDIHQVAREEFSMFLNDGSLVIQ